MRSALALGIIALTCCCCNKATADDANVRHTNSPSSVADLWRIPGLTAEPVSESIYVVSDRIVQSLAACKEVVKAVSDGTGPVVSDQRQFARARVLSVEGGQARWKVTIYQAYSHQGALEIARSFFVLNSLRAYPNLEWDGKKIGNVSAGHHQRGMADKPYVGAVFVRGNVAIQIQNAGVAIHAEESEGKIHADPRQVAALLDAYLLDEPKAPDDAAKVAAITVALEKPGESGADGSRVDAPTAGMTYRLKLSPQAKMVGEGASAAPSSDDVSGDRGRSVDASELRIHATHADIVGQADGAILIKFLAAGRQTVKCYYIGSEGNMVARGEVAVDVKGASPLPVVAIVVVLLIVLAMLAMVRRVRRNCRRYHA